MKSTTPSLVLAASVAASVLSAILCVLGLREVWGAERTDPALRVELASLGERIDGLAERFASEAAPSAGPPASSELVDAVSELRLRLDRVESAARRQPVAQEPAAGDALAGGAAGEPADAHGAGKPKRLRLARDEFVALLGPVLAGSSDVSPEEQARFWETARSSGYVDELVDELETSIARDPSDVGTRLELADAYVAKLLTVPAGPERGVWGMQAETQWKAVLELDPRSWDAQFRIAESLSYYPEFLNKTGEAIVGLEEARRIQEETVSEPRHAQTYLLLSRVYARDGRTEDALAALRDGLLRHPGNEELARALADMEDR